MCKSSNKVVSPAYRKGFDHQKGLIAKVFVLMTVAYFLALIPGSYLKPAPKFCTDEEPDCRRPEFLAFEIVCGSVFLWQSFTSIRSWHIRKTPMKDLPNNPIGRVYGYSKESETIAAVSFAFQFWDLVATPFIPEFSSPIMLGHHLLAALVSLLALQYQYYHYYVVFFLALTEVSSIPLVLMSVGNYYPPAPGSNFELVKTISEPLFAVTFAYYRVFLWIKVTRQLWSDGIHCLSKGIAEEYRPGKSFALYIILGVSAALTVLQLFWFSLISTACLRAAGFDVPDINPGFE